MELSGVMLITTHVEECTAFYATLLQGEARLGAGWAQFDLADGRMLALHSPWDPSLPTEAGSSVTLLEVTALDDHVARLSTAGIPASDPHDIPGGRVVTLTDPDGRLVQLVEHIEAE